MTLKNAGYSIVELLIGLCLAALISVAAYRLTTHLNLKGTQTVRGIRANQEANKALDRITTEINNAIAMTDARATLLGSLLFSGTPIPSETCKTSIISYNGPAIYFEPHGFVPLPGRKKSEIDLDSTLLLIDPSEATVGENLVADADSDGIRVAFIPIDSQPIPLASDTAGVMHTVAVGYAPISVDVPGGQSLQNLIEVGDFAIIYKAGGRELIRVTGIFGRQIAHLQLSFWNLPFQTDFESDRSFIQKVGLVTYAHDPDTRQLFRDNHRMDDHFNPSTHAFGAPGRVTNWEVVAQNIRTFQVQYDVFDTHIDSTNRLVRDLSDHLTRTPQATRAYTDCKNEVGYPLFKNALIEIATESIDGGLVILSRRATSKNLTRQPGGGSGDKGDLLILTALPTAPPVANPTATPIDTPTPLPNPTNTPTPEAQF